jgi:hypothetical protein
MFGDNELENCVAQKLQPLIIKMIALRLMAEAGVRQCFRQQQRIAEFVTNAFFERCHIRVILSELREYYMSLTRDKAGDNRQANPRLLVDEPSLRYRL